MVAPFSVNWMFNYYLPQPPEINHKVTKANAMNQSWIKPAVRSNGEQCFWTFCGCIRMKQFFSSYSTLHYLIYMQELTLPRIRAPMHLTLLRSFLSCQWALTGYQVSVPRGSQTWRLDPMGTPSSVPCPWEPGRGTAPPIPSGAPTRCQVIGLSFRGSS